MRFLGNVLATIVGLFVFCMFFFFGILLLGALLGGDAETVEVKNNSVIVLDLSKVTTDYAGKFNYKDFDYFDARHDGLSDVIKAIKNALCQFLHAKRILLKLGCQHHLSKSNW